MPHSLFLGSALSAQDRLSPKTKPKAQLVLPTTLAPDADATLRSPFRMALTSLGASIRNALMPHRSEGIGSRVNRHVDHSNRALSFVKAHLRHAIADVVSSLLGFAVIINSFILVLAAAVFFYSPTGPTEGPASLFDAHALIAERVGRGAATLFAVALLFSGQSSALIGTLAGQVVADGFVRWNAPPVVRRILTRSVALIPGMIVAAVQGKDGIDALLVASQVVLAGVLPFVTLPLLILTSDKGVMSVRRSSLEERERARDEGEVTRVERELDQQDTDEKAGATAPDAGAAEVDDEEMVSFANGKIVQAFGYISWLLLVIANIYVLVELGQGKGGSH
jgi:metal iron transporter